MFERSLQVLNLVLLALFGVAGWRMVDEWRKSREERHQVDLALRDQKLESSKATLESLKITHQHELEKRDLRIDKLEDEKNRLTEHRDKEVSLLEREIGFFKAQAPAGVLANFEASKKLFDQELMTYEKKLKESEKVRSAERLEWAAKLKTKDLVIEQLELKSTASATSDDFGIGLETVLGSATITEIRTRGRAESSQLTHEPIQRLIQMLGHQDCQIRESAAQELGTRGEPATAELVQELAHVDVLSGLVFSVVGRLWGKKLQRVDTSMRLLARIGDPAVPGLTSLSHRDAPPVKLRAEAVLQHIQQRKG